MVACALVFLGAGCAPEAEPAPETDYEENEEKTDEKHAEETLADGEYTANASESTLEWEGEKVVGKHDGTINLQSGSLTVVDGQVTAGEAVIDMTSIVCTDLEGDSKASLEDHLKSDDFFGVEAHPTATFSFTSFEGGILTGNLTLKGVTKELSFPAEMHAEDGGIHLEGTATIDRTEFDIKFGSGKFFENLGDKAIDDEFTLELDVEFAPSA